MIEDEFYSVFEVSGTFSAERLCDLEDRLYNDFTVIREIGPWDSLLYRYKVGNNLGQQSITRQGALMSYLLEHKDMYYNRVQDVFKSSII